MLSAYLAVGCSRARRAPPRAASPQLLHGPVGEACRRRHTGVTEPRAAADRAAAAYARSAPSMLHCDFCCELIQVPTKHISTRSWTVLGARCARLFTMVKQTRKKVCEGLGQGTAVVFTTSRAADVSSRRARRRSPCGWSALTRQGCMPEPGARAAVHTCQLGCTCVVAAARAALASARAAPLRHCDTHWDATVRTSMHLHCDARRNGISALHAAPAPRRATPRADAG